MIKVDDISVKLRDKIIIDKIKFDIPSGQIIMLLGENGCGKTTLIKAMLGLYPLEKGKIMYEAQNLKNLTLKQKAAIFAYMPQIKDMVDNITCLEVVISGLSRHHSILHIPDHQDEILAKKIMADFGILELAQSRIDQISGGQLQMVYLCRSFIQDAKCILMDEPCTYLDFIKQHRFLKEVIKLKSLGKSVLLSIHDPALALKYGDQIVLMHQGKIKAIINKDGDMAQKLQQLYQEIYPDQNIEIGGKNA
ncbi:MAG: ABC transporter ATP-binding protein [Erysipelotrichaceae bacterium]|nr:ABC transporter ATP-binding protein [Erysipelotrichaceae bacterium]MDY5251647.1 ABC transporter ATP-binding protein [Erysipelotrichaceae bacterium]